MDVIIIQCPAKMDDLIRYLDEYLIVAFKDTKTYIINGYMTKVCKGLLEIDNGIQIKMETITKIIVVKNVET